MKKEFLERWLPMWAKQTVYRDNRALSRKVRQLQQENETLRAYIKGLHKGLRPGTGPAAGNRRNYETI